MHQLSITTNDELDEQHTFAMTSCPAWPSPVGRCNEYQPMGGDSVWLGSKGRYDLYLVAGVIPCKTCVMPVKCAVLDIVEVKWYEQYKFIEAWQHSCSG